MIRLLFHAAITAATLAGTFKVCTHVFERKPDDVLVGLRLAMAVGVVHVLLESVVHYYSRH